MSLNPLSQNWGPVQRHSQSLWTEEARKHINEALVLYPNFEDWRQRNSVFADLAFSTAGAATISGTDAPERIDIAGCSANFFSVLGVSPVLGRVFSPSEFEGRQSVALISYGFWQRRFGGESDAVGKSIRIDEGNATVIGILPPSFTFPLGRVAAKLARRLPHDGNRPHTCVIIGLPGMSEQLCSVGEPGVDVRERPGRHSAWCWNEPFFAGRKQLHVNPGAVGVSEIMAVG